MCLKVYGYKSNNFKYPVTALFKQLMMTTFGFLEGMMVPIIEKERQFRKEQSSTKSLVSVNNLVKEEIVDTSKKQENAGANSEINKDNLKTDKTFNSEQASETSYQRMYFNNAKKKTSESIDRELLKFNNTGYVEGQNSLMAIKEIESQEIYQITLKLLKNLICIAEGKKKDWVSNNIFSKCLAIELISGIVCQSGYVMKYLPEFNEIIKTELLRIIKKSIDSTNDYITGNSIL